MNPLAPTTALPSRETSENMLVQAIKEYQTALDSGDPPDREAFLAGYAEIATVLADCLDNLEFMRNIAPQLTDQNATSAGRGSPDSAAAPTAGLQHQLGDFRIIREVGRGGMGVVYEAEQISMSRHVALKVLPFAAVLDQKVLQRFRSEAQVAGQLVHQNIVPVYSVGCERSVHYYAMQFIKGMTLAELILELKEPRVRRPESKVRSPDSSDGEDHSPSQIRSPKSELDTSAIAALSTARSNHDLAYIRSAANLMIQVAQALEYAHGQGVIHRDIKPSNLMVDGQGKVWVTDFGLAHVESGPSVTITGDFLGTLRYMSPEQALAQRVVVDHRTDIYSLGLTFYELLTQRPAFTGSNRQELLRQISFDEPPRPRRTNKAIPPDLETILLKSMEKNPTDRYSTADELAEDIQRFVDDRPIHARPPTLAQRSAKWCRRHKLPVATIAVTVLVLLACIAAGSSVMAVRLNRMAEQEKDIAQKERAARRDVERANKQIAIELASRYVDHAQMLCERGDIGQGLHWLVHSLHVAPDDSVALRHVIRKSLAAWSTRLHSLEAILPHEQPVTTVAFCSDGSRVFTGCSDGSGRLWDTAIGKTVREPIEHQGAIETAAFNAVNNAIATGTEKGMVRLIDAATGQSVKAFQVRGAIRSLAFKKDGSQILVGTAEGNAALLESTTGGLIAELRKLRGPMDAASFSPDGLPLVVESFENAHQILNVTSGKPIGSAVRHLGVTDAVIAPDGIHFATGGLDNRLILWDSITAKKVGGEMLHYGDISAVAMTADGTLLASGGLGVDVSIWDVSAGNSIGNPLRHRSPVRAIAFGPVGRRLLTGCDDGTVSLWKIASAPPSVSSIVTGTGRTGHYSDVALGPDGLHIIARDKDGSAQIWDVSAQVPIGQPFVQEGGIKTVAFSPDGKRVLTGAGSGELQMWDAFTRKPIGNAFLHVIPSSRYQTIRAVAFSPDGSRIVTASENGTAQLWNAATGEPIGPPLRHKGSVICVAFSPDGSRILTGSFDNTALLWDAARQERLGDPFQHESDVVGVAFSPDGKRIATASTRSCRVWDVATRQVIGRPLQHDQGLNAIAFGPDAGKAHILTGSPDGTARLWDVETGKPIGPPITHDDSVWHVAFSPDRTKLLVAGEGTVRIWPRLPDPVVGVLERIELWIEVITGMTLNMDAGGTFDTIDTPTWRARRRQLDELGGPPML